MTYNSPLAEAAVNRLRTAAVVVEIEANATQIVMHNENCRSLATAP
jgi:hypothetical protein